MIANLQEAFKELVDESDWMDEKTKEVAIEKVYFNYDSYQLLHVKDFVCFLIISYKVIMIKYQF